jgi:hypothetical protein
MLKWKAHVMIWNSWSEIVTCLIAGREMWTCFSWHFLQTERLLIACKLPVNISNIYFPIYFSSDQPCSVVHSRELRQMVLISHYSQATSIFDRLGLDEPSFPYPPFQFFYPTLDRIQKNKFWDILISWAFQNANNIELHASNRENSLWPDSSSHNISKFSFAKFIRSRILGGILGASKRKLYRYFEHFTIFSQIFFKFWFVGMR